jgi:hypothetical protein
MCRLLAHYFHLLYISDRNTDDGIGKLPHAPGDLPARIAAEGHLKVKITSEVDGETIKVANLELR